MKEAQNINSKNFISPLELLLLLVVFIIPLWPRYAMIYVEGLPNINLTRLLIVSLIMLWGITVLGFKDKMRYISRKVIENKTIFMLLALFVIVRFFTVFVSTNFVKSFYVATNELLVCILLFAVGMTVWKTSHQVYRTLLVMTLSSLVVATFGLYEAYVGHNVFLDMLPPPPSESADYYFTDVYRVGYRIKSTFTNPLAMAEYLVFMMPIIIYVHSSTNNKFVKLMSLASGVFSIAAIWFTESRGAIVVSMIMGLLYLSAFVGRYLKIKKGSKKIFVSVVFFFALVGMVITVITTTVILVQGRTRIESKSSTARMIQLQEGLKKVVEKPFTGYGPGEALIGRAIDNYYLSLILESGVFSLILFVGIIIKFIQKSFLLFNAHLKHLKLMAGVIGLSLIGFTVFMAVLSLRDIFSFVFIQFAMLVALDEAYMVSQKEISCVAQ